MSYRSFKRVVWLVLPLGTVALMLGLLWHSEQIDTEAMAVRGSKEAVERKFSLGDPGSWTEAGGSGRWFGEGVESVMTWKHNPWKRERIHLGERFQDLRNSTDPADQEIYQNLVRLGREWHERLLARYPELTMAGDKPMPEEKNAFFKLMVLFRDIEGDPQRRRSELVPEEFKVAGVPLDRMAAETILTDNRDLLDRFREIGLMTGHSSHGYDPGDERPGSWNLLRGGDLLLLDARLAAAQGDTALALESIRAARGLADHLAGVSAAGSLEALLAGTVGMQIRSQVMESILPSLPADGIDLAAWESAVGGRISQPQEYAAMLRVDWNQTMRSILPALADTSDVSVPHDSDLYLEIHTRYLRDQAGQAGSKTLAEMAGNPVPVPSVEHLSWRSGDLAKSQGMSLSSENFTRIWLNQQASAGMTQAAFAILNGKPVPADPVSGLPYRWDPATRMLSLPDIPAYERSYIKPVKLPKR